jgi:alkylation response protein AidB-like acyl-CoA dehydrogenase
MTETVLGLHTDISTDKVRASSKDMRCCIRQVAERGRETWTGELTDLVAALGEVARVDLCLARVVEGHADGLRIIDQAGHHPHEGVYGVWASRSVGTGTKAANIDGGWHVRGELRFASGVDLIDRALVPAWLDDDHHVLLDINASDAKPDLDSWRTSGMDASRTLTVLLDIDSADADRIGDPNFYLDRPGFVVGGLCVAAVWAGGAQHIVDLVTNGVRRFLTTPHQLRRIGLMEQAAWQARTAVESTVRELPRLATSQAEREIAQARTAVVSACDTVLTEAAVVVGPAGLSRNARLARTINDLAIYLRQHHVDGELTRLGEHSLYAHEVLAK